MINSKNAAITLISVKKKYLPVKMNLSDITTVFCIQKMWKYLKRMKRYANSQRITVKKMISSLRYEETSWMRSLSINMNKKKQRNDTAGNWLKRTVLSKVCNQS